MNNYSIWSLDYAYNDDHPKALTMFGEFNSEFTKLNLGYHLLIGNGHTILIDTGFDYRGESKEIADFYKIRNFHFPGEVLGQVGVKPEEIDSILITHAHIDHASNIKDFPNATFYIQSRELFMTIWALAAPKRYGCLKGAIILQDVMSLLETIKDNRLVLLDGDTENILPGIDAFTAFDTHSFGGQFFRVRNDGVPSDKPWIFCGDLVFRSENLEGRNKDGVYVPILNGGGGHYNILLAYDKMMNLTGWDAQRIIPMHDPEVANMFPSRCWSEGLNIVEIQLANGEASRL